MLLYNVLLPVVMLLSLPMWLKKTKRRGGYGTGVSERWALFWKPKSAVMQGSVYVHAVSVGEALIAKKLIQRWLSESEGEVLRWR